MAKTKRSKTHRVSSEGVRIIQNELNRWEKASWEAEVLGQPGKKNDMDMVAGGVQALANRLGVFCSCRKPTESRSARQYCKCTRQTSTKATRPRSRGTMLSGCRLDLSGNCRDKAGKFVPVRNCTGRGPAPKKPKKKTKPKKKATRG